MLPTPGEDFGIESRGLRESYVPRAEPLNAQPRGLYLSSEVGHESRVPRAEPLTTNQEDYANL